MQQCHFNPLFFTLLFLSILALLVHFALKSGYHLTYSVSRSVPKNIYLVMPSREFKRGDLVQFIPPEPFKKFLLTKHWLPQSGLMLKYVYAVPGDFVCNENHVVMVNKRKVGPVYTFYNKKNKLPQTKFCGKLTDNQYLLMSTCVKRSYDGRYFGPVRKTNIVGKVFGENLGSKY